MPPGQRDKERITFVCRACCMCACARVCIGISRTQEEYLLQSLLCTMQHLYVHSSVSDAFRRRYDSY